MEQLKSVTRRAALGVLGASVVARSAWAAPDRCCGSGRVQCYRAEFVDRQGGPVRARLRGKEVECRGWQDRRGNYRIEFTNLDDESKPERAVAGAERLLSGDKVSVIFTPPASTPTLAMLPIVERNKVLAMSFVASAPQVVSPEYSYSFRDTLTSVMTVAPAIDYL